ncbi:TIGR03364 family FAD-dependent oxidoreductase [Enemella sp. A6]|uniref:TIGR03364 family FAD-dependent oxidoreductase n=1 Tax=Enemella sp. A6 TaxID=3440152 RepID=UPI003EB919DD
MNDARSDLVIVGGGIIGLAHAFEAVRRGLRVQLIERDRRPVGASVRNFGHACITAQSGPLADLAMHSRVGWLRAAEEAGFWAREAGCVVVARSEAELAVLEAFRADRGAEDVHLLAADQVRDRLRSDDSEPDPRIVGGAFLPLDLRVDPRTTAPMLADWLAAHPLVDLHWGTHAHHVDSGVVHTNRGQVRGQHVLVCVGHDLDRLHPADAERHQVRRCRLQMALVDQPGGYTLDSAVLTGTSMLRYAAMAGTPAAVTVREELTAAEPELMAMDPNVMFTRRPDGTLLIGDSHHYDLTVDPFLEEDISERLLAEVATITGTNRWRVRQRWQGVYAHSPLTDLLVTTPAPGVTTVTVTSGIGMTLAFGVAGRTLDRL